MFEREGVSRVAEAIVGGGCWCVGLVAGLLGGWRWSERTEAGEGHATRKSHIHIVPMYNIVPGM